MTILCQKVKNLKITMSLNDKRVSSIILINLVLTFVSLSKDILLAWYLGTSTQADAYLLAYFVVDTIGNNLLANALGVAVIPVLAGLYESGENMRLNKLAHLVVLYTVIISTLIAFLMFGLRFGLLSWVGAGLVGPSRQLSLGLFTLLIPSLVVFPLVNIGISIMQVHNRFTIPALAPVLYNTIYLIGLSYLLLFKTPLVIGVYGLSIFIMVGLLMMLFLVWFPIFKYRLISLPTCASLLKLFSINRFGELIKQRLWTVSVDLITVWKSFLPYLITLLFPQTIYFVERYLASHLETGSISGLNYAFRLVQFPQWVFIAAVSSVLIPMLAKLSAMEDKQDFNRVLMSSIYLTAMITIPFTIILFVLRVPIISILLLRGEFNSNSMAITASIMAGYTLTIIWQGFSVIWVRAAIIKGKVFYALMSAAVSAGFTVGLDYFLVPIVGVAGLGYGAAIGAMINFFMLYRTFYKYRQFRFLKIWRGFSKIILANLPLLLVTKLFSQAWVLIAEINTFVANVSYVMVVIIVCLSTYWLGFKAFKVKLLLNDL